MKIKLLILFLCFFTTIYGQTDHNKILLDSAKALFKSERNATQEELDKFNYDEIVSLLEQVIKVDPNNAEARYFLGHTYGRLNSRDGRGMIDMNLELLYKTSKQFEKVIELTPKYSGEIIALDPYSKLTSEWGSMAMSYLYNNKINLAVWAFKEGKKRGGFDDFILELNKNILDACSKNSILISLGDSFSIPLWYLQTVENYRTDVSIVDISLLNSVWYPTFLSNKKSISFDISNKELETIEYIKWVDSIVKIKDFSWTVKPTFYDQYLLRGDRIFLSLLKENKFQRDLFFTIGFIESQRLSLKNYLTSFFIVDKLSVFKKSPLPYKKYKKVISKNLKLSKLINKNSSDQLGLLDNLRYNLLTKIDELLNNNDKNNAKELLDLLSIYADDKKFPYQNKSIKKYIDYLREKI